jgi:hypothetical protein
MEPPDKMVANDLDEELDIALDDLNNETDKFSELFDTDKLEILIIWPRTRLSIGCYKKTAYRD